jgi:hypothetical protein
MPRRAEAGLSLLIAAAVLLAGSLLLPSTEPARASDATAVSVRTANAFVQSIGVNTHTYYTDTVYYRRFRAIERRLRELGVHHIRENLMPDRRDQYRRLNQLAAIGIHSTLIVGDPRNGLAGMRSLVKILATRLAGGADAAEGPNEFDLSGEPSWGPRLARYQAALYRAVKSTRRLAAVPVVGPSLGNPNNVANLRDLSRYLDYGNIHSYPDGEPPEANLADALQGARRTSGSKPVLATETGYHDALRADSGQQPVSETAAAIYLPRLYLDYFAQGVARTFPYELVDEHPDPAADEPESSFGLLRNDLSPKPAFTAIRNLIAILEDPGTAFAPGSLDYALSGDTTDLSQVLLEKRDGRFYLALWRTDSVWDPEARSALRPISTPLTLSFGSQPLSLHEYLPNASSEPTRALTTSAGATSVEVGPRVVIVEIQPG